MNLYLERESGELRDKTGELIGVEDSGPPWSIPDDAMDVIEAQFPNDHASVSVEDLHWTLAAAGGRVEFGTPPK